MGDALHTVVETPRYLRDAAQAGLEDEERRLIVDSLANEPGQGVEVRGSGGVRKVRIAGRGRGKSGGHRVMSAYFGERFPVYLLALLSKSDRANFSPAEIASMKDVMTSLKQAWRVRQGL